MIVACTIAQSKVNIDADDLSRRPQGSQIEPQDCWVTTAVDSEESDISEIVPECSQGPVMCPDRIGTQFNRKDFMLNLKIVTPGRLPVTTKNL